MSRSGTDRFRHLSDENQTAAIFSTFMREITERLRTDRAALERDLEVGVKGAAIGVLGVWCREEIEKNRTLLRSYGSRLSG